MDLPSPVRHLVRSKRTKLAFSLPHLLGKRVRHGLLSFCREGSTRRFATSVMNSVLAGSDRLGQGNLGLGTCEAFAKNDDAYAKKRHILEQELANRIEPGEATDFGVKDR